MSSEICKKNLYKIILCAFFLFAFSHLLDAQRLQDDSLSYLYGKSVMPQDRELGLMYLPGKGDREEIFTKVQDFWNAVNTGEIPDALLSRTGRKQILEQVAPFLNKRPLLPEKEDSEGKNTEEEGTAEKNTKEPKLPLRSLELSQVRLANPVIERDYARIRCRLELQQGSAFLFVRVFLLKESNLWRIDVLDVDWDKLEKEQSNVPIEVFGRKQGLYKQ